MRRESESGNAASAMRFLEPGGNNDRAMARLTDILEELLASLAWHGEPVEALKKGLLLSEIEDVISRLPFHLPEEVSELYQWRNGTASTPGEMVNFRPYYRFLPLQEAVDHTLGILKSQQHYWSHPNKYPSTTFSPPHNVECLFPILALEDRCFYCVQGSLTDSNPASLVYEDIIDAVPVPVAASVTGLFKSLLECWNVGVYSVNPSPRYDVSPYDDFVINALIEKSIFARNSGSI
jgi:hypothetical protein